LKYLGKVSGLTPASRASAPLVNVTKT
jgi:hypothetical protein